MVTGLSDETEQKLASMGMTDEKAEQMVMDNLKVYIANQNTGNGDSIFNDAQVAVLRLMCFNLGKPNAYDDAVKEYKAHHVTH